MKDPQMVFELEFEIPPLFMDFAHVYANGLAAVLSFDDPALNFNFAGRFCKGEFIPDKTSKCPYTVTTHGGVRAISIEKAH
jgi:hypothetical protein